MFSNKFCDLLFHASFTKFTGPAKVFLKNNILYFKKRKKKKWILGFFLWWSLQRGQLNKSPCGCKKNVTKTKKKIHNSIKLDPLSCPLIPIIFIKRYTRSIIFKTFVKKNEQFLSLFVKKLFRGSLKMSTKYCVTNPKKELPISLKYVLDSFPFTPYVFIKRYTWSIQFIENWAFPELIPKLI